jgi:hopene-associated glycosyltransferase HpnB
MTLMIALAAAAAWAVLLFGRGFFWLAREDDRDAALLPEPASWPAVTVIVPARDEADGIAATVRSLLAQDYSGALRLIVVDDRSTDGTGAIALAAGRGDPRLRVLTGAARPPGWTGKLWALQQGLGAARPHDPLLLFTDADIVHARDSVRRLVQRLLAGRLVLVSLMARLSCAGAAERWLIPAFLFFFQMLYPFRWSNRPGTRTAAAAGGCMLLDSAAFAAAGGLPPIRDAIIDDCALARRMKARGPTWIGLTDRVVSTRRYGSIGPIRRMVARTAYAQLGHRPAALAGMLAALALIFLAPPLLALLAAGPARWIGLGAWLAMAVAVAPTLRRHRLAPWRGLLLPGIAALYMLFTVDSALAEWRGRGGFWKGEAGPRADPQRFVADTKQSTALDESVSGR